MPLQQDVQGTRSVNCKDCDCLYIIDLATTCSACPGCGCTHINYYFGTIDKKFH
jgi:hypothetical protein